jgi:hypothetical protein
MSHTAEHDYTIFLDLLQKALISLSTPYFQLPIHGEEDPIYRERVYCYELYHQLRKNWPDTFRYSLSGEVDKNGHPRIRGNNLDHTKPDLLVHIPREMANNLVILEVKSINASRQGVEKDLKTLTAYRKNALYQYAIYLVYGNSKNGIDPIVEYANSLSNEHPSEIDLSLIFLYHQHAPNTEARYIEWPNDNSRKVVLH